MEKKNRAAEHAALAMLLTVLGGVMDGYSYAVRGGVFATGQTGNLIIFGFSLVHGQYDRAFRALVPILGFWGGIFAAQFILDRFSREKEEHRWKGVVLFVEAAVLLAIGFVPDSVLDIVPNTLISILAAMQFSSFRLFGSQSTYASVFCTGNMRACAEQYYQGLVRKDKQALRRAFQYTGIILSFLLGALAAMGLGGRIGEKAIWLGTALALMGGCVFVFDFSWKNRRRSSGRTP